MEPIYDYDEIDGKLVYPLIITTDYTLTGIHRGTIHVEHGTLYIRGILQGTLDVQSGANVVIIGQQQGTVSISPGASITTIGIINGTVHLDEGACLIIEESGKLGGTLNNEGLVILRGVFGGSNWGDGQLIVEGKGYIKNPTIHNGIKFYEW